MTDQYLDGSRQENGNEINLCKNQNIKFDPYADIRYLSHHESKITHVPSIHPLQYSKLINKFVFLS